MARGPNRATERFKGYVINGFRFHTKDREANRKTQNSGIVVVASTSSYASAKDQNPVAGDVTYYGILNDIMELNYYEHFKITLFKCDWADIHSYGKGVRKDDFGFTLVNFNRLLFTGDQLSDEPFILACQAKQVFYVQDPVEKDWKVVIHTKPRDFFDMQQEVSTDDIEVHLENIIIGTSTNEAEEEFSWNKNDVPELTIDTPLINAHVLETNTFHDAELHNDNEVNGSMLI